MFIINYKGRWILGKRSFTIPFHFAEDKCISCGLCENTIVFLLQWRDGKRSRRSALSLSILRNCRWIQIAIPSGAVSQV